MLCSTNSADSLAELSEFNVPLRESFHILTTSEPPFTPPTNVGGVGDLVLLLTFCQRVLLVLSAYGAAARKLALCISTSLRHCCSECLKSFFVTNYAPVTYMPVPPVLGLLWFTHSQKAAFAILSLSTRKPEKEVGSLGYSVNGHYEK